eukprot:CAMPEP_0169377912 /NCGR_PEP_ID=MMETSP1017-20121227/39461_1 /TAXON_ID=342587 /ORGANISM="Karlodinium micrum, Strain CCMP2283" /LENGTH=179 /DNA_ID=CAMNT_0009477063 /DNA_START=38 /DNA_END=573 /DNA_ORIENTATION=-
MYKLFLLLPCFQCATLTTPAEDLVLAQFLLARGPHAYATKPRVGVRESAPSPIEMVLQAQSEYLKNRERKTWFETLNLPVWGEPSDVSNKASQEAMVNAALDAQCRKGLNEACEALSREEEAKAAWIAQLAKKQQKPWASAASEMTAEAAKAAWIANWAKKQEKPWMNANIARQVTPVT